MGFPKFNNRRDAISTEDLPTVDIGFQVNLQPFQHETVAKIEWNAFAHASKQRKDYTINSSILTSLMDLDNATAAIDPHESLLLTHLRVTCKRFLDRSLAPSDQFMHGIRHLLLKAHGLPLAGAMDVLHEKLLSFAEFVVAEAKESGAPIGKREGKLVDEQVERSKNANYRELRDEGLEKARKCLILYSEMMNRAPQALCEDAVKQCLVAPLFDPEHSNQKFSQDFFFLAYIIADMLDKQMGMVGEWLPQFLVTGTRNPSSKKKTSFNLESVQTAEWWAQIFAATGLNDEDQELVLSWQKFKKPAYRFLWAFAAVAGVYPGTNGGFVNICKGYFTGDSPNRAIDKILPRHQWTTRDEQAIVGHALNMYKADYGSSNKLEAQNKDGVVVEPKEEGEEQQTLQISRLDLRDLLCRLMFAEAVNEYGQPVSYKLSEMRKITKIALQTHITVEAPLLARLALSVGLPLGFLFTAAKTAELKEAGIHDGMAEKDVDKAISAYRDLLRVEQLEKQKVRRRERGQVGSDDDSGSTSSDEAEE